jgi:hypothetical protein
MSYRLEEALTKSDSLAFGGQATPQLRGEEVAYYVNVCQLGLQVR